MGTTTERAFKECRVLVEIPNDWTLTSPLAPGEERPTRGYHDKVGLGVSICVLGVLVVFDPGWGTRVLRSVARVLRSVHSSVHSVVDPLLVAACLLWIVLRSRGKGRSYWLGWLLGGLTISAGVAMVFAVEWGTRVLGSVVVVPLLVAAVLLELATIRRWW
jgi:hypothetical protein